MMPKDVRAIHWTKAWTRAAKPKILVNMDFFTRRTLAFCRTSGAFQMTFICVGPGVYYETRNNRLQMAVEWAA